MTTVSDFVDLDSDTAREKYSLPADGRSWRVAWAQSDLRDSGPDEKNAVPICYRPFDLRWTYYTGKSCGFICWPRDDVMKHLLFPNIALVTCRQTNRDEWSHVLVTSQIIEDSFVSNQSKETGYVYPVALTADAGGTSREENFTTEFRTFLDKLYEHHYSAEEIFGYIYAILHAPTYRERYAVFLRRDFPRIPFPDTAEGFETLSALGWALVEAHLLRTVPKRGLADYHGKGSHEIEAVRYVPSEEAVWINQTQHFAPVPPEVWEFRIGGYQVLDKYLKSRRDRTLALDEINHVARVADALAFTIDQMQHIDDAYRAAFPEDT